MALYQVATNQAIEPLDLDQFYNLLTGVMTDQLVTLGHGLSVTGGVAPTGTAGFEAYYDGTNVNVNAYNRPGTAALPMLLTASKYIFQTGDIGVGTPTPLTLEHLVSPGSGINISFDDTTNRDTGAFIGTAGSSDSHITGAAKYTAGAWVAKGTVASIFQQNSAEFVFYSNTGLTIGNTFAPTERFRIKNSSHLVSSGPSVGLGALQTGISTQAVSGTDAVHKLTVVTTASPPGANGVVAVVNFATSFSSWYLVGGTDNTTSTNNNVVFVFGISAGGYNIFCGSAMAASNTYEPTMVVFE